MCSFGSEQISDVGHLLTQAVYGVGIACAVVVMPTVPKKNIPSGPVTAVSSGPAAGLMVTVASGTVASPLGSS